MRNSQVLGICILVLLVLAVPICYSIQTTEETSTVARIVGESPQELITQMQRTDVNIDHATYFSNDEVYQNKKSILHYINRLEKNRDIFPSSWKVTVFYDEKEIVYTHVEG